MTDGELTAKQCLPLLGESRSARQEDRSLNHFDIVDPAAAMINQIPGYC